MVGDLIKIGLYYAKGLIKIVIDPELSLFGKIVAIPVFTVATIINVIISTAVLWLVAGAIFLIIAVVGG